MIIKNKLESIKKINELCLNKFPEQLFRSGEEIKVLEFLEKYPAKFYAIRDKSKACGTFKLKVSSEDVLAEIKDYNLFNEHIYLGTSEELDMSKVTMLNCNVI